MAVCSSVLFRAFPARLRHCRGCRLLIALADSDCPWWMRGVAGLMREGAEIAVHASRTASPKPAFGRSLLLGTVAALFLSMVGALGTHSAPVLPRTAYWLVIMLTGAALGGGVAFAIQSWGQLRHRKMLEGAVISALIAVPLTSVVIAAGMVVFHTGLPTGSTVVSHFGAVLMVSALMTALGYATADPDPSKAEIPLSPSEIAAAPETGPGPGTGAPPPAEPGATREAPPPLMVRLPPRLRAARLLALEAEDHYLRVHTDAGSDLILMRLSDAISETGTLAGARCHRSWWVARDAVAGATRRGAGAVLTLDCGIEVPVSRSLMPALKADGWV
jgi:hypothetical protein